MRKTRILFMILLAVTLVGTTSFTASKRVLKLAHNYPVGHPHYQAVELFKKLVEERTYGAIEIQVFPNNQLGNARQVFENLVIGSIDMAVTAPETPAQFGQPKLWDIINSPYMYHDYNQAYKALHSPAFAQLMDQAEREIGITTLDPMWYYGIRQLTMATKSVQTSADLKGMKVRAPDIPIFMKTVELMGARPVPVSFPDLYLALKQKVVDGQENPVATILANKYYEAQKYLILTGHILSINAAFMKTSAMHSLTTENQKIIRAAIVEAGRYNDKLMRDSEDDITKQLVELGMIIVKPDVKAFREAVSKGLKSWFSPEQYDFYSKMQSYN